jgi:putative tricarboxylic transport membrane protein
MTPEPEIVVEDADAPAADSPPVASIRTVDVIVCLLLLALAAFLGFDNWRTGIAWAPEGPEAGYFPFYLSVILAAASLYGLASALFSRAQANETFVTRDQLRRVLQVFVPTLLFCLFHPMARALPCELSAHCRLYVFHRADCFVEVAYDRFLVLADDVHHL